MCGLVGVFSKDLDEKMKKAFTDMLVVDAVRGEDSTGVAIGKPSYTPGNNIQYEIKKSVGNPFDFFSQHTFQGKSRVMTHARCNVLMGHNRAATIGKVVVENAHPFEYEHIIGAHNGTLYMSSLKEMDGYDKFDVDSQIIYQHLNNHGLEAVWQKADGAMALSWIDKRDDSLNLCRNSERSLYFCKTKDGKGILWASEMIFIYLGAYRHGVKIEDPEEVKTNLHHKFSYDKDGNIILETKELKPFVRVTTPFRQTSYGAHYGENYGSGYYDDWGWEDPKKVDKKREEKTKETKTVTFQILDIHKQDNYCFAIGQEQESEDKIRIFIPHNKMEEAEKKIVGRGSQAGYYVTTAARQSNFQGCNWFVNWNDINWVMYKNKASNVVEFDDSSAPWYSKSQRLSKLAYMTRVECGCGNCRKPANWDDRNDILWASRDEFYCAECKNDPIVKDWVQSLYAQGQG